MRVRRVVWGVGLAWVAAGCADTSEEETAPPPAAAVTAPVVSASSLRAPVVHIRQAYFPRRVDVDYWETIPRNHAAPEFFLQVQPRIKTPAEGPWIATFINSAGEEVVRLPGLRVDVATGNFLFLCSRPHFRPGDWTIRLEVAEGGMVGIEGVQTFRFRVE